jgi:prepilin-type N-terminal cleavage/methylation domain-containing protein
MHISNKGFTLAEVLITLLIIGVIASIVIPGLIADTRMAEQKAAWKKAYSDLSQATTRIKMDNGGSLKGVFADSNALRDAYLELLSYTKKCDKNQSTGNCWHANDGSSKYLYGGGITAWNNDASAILSNGTFVLFGFLSQDCTSTVAGTNPNLCGALTIDINGFKGPNTQGKDIFQTWLFDNRITPQGIQGDNREPNITCIEGDTQTTNTGWGCAALYTYQ